MSGRDQFVPVTREDVTDLELLPRRFDMFVADVRLTLERLGDKIGDKLITAVQRIEDAVGDLAERVGSLEHAQESCEKAHRQMARRLDALEKRLPRPRRARGPLSKRKAKR